MESDITFHVGKQEAELALTVNNVVFNRDLYQLKGLIRARADPNKTDYDGRSPLHLAASRGYEDITIFLIQERVDVNIIGNCLTYKIFIATRHLNFDSQPDTTIIIWVIL